MKYVFQDTQVKFEDLVHIVDKTESTYFDNDEFKNGRTFKDYGLGKITAQKAELVSDAMIMCWNLDHKPKFEEHCKRRDVAVQAGGFIGIYPYLLSQIFKSVYTFEPHPLNFHCLVNNCQSPNIHKFNAALGNEHKLVGLGNGLDANPGMYKVVEDHNSSGIPQLKIDDLALTSCDLIQLDIEGAEIAALEGGKETIEKYKPTICCEVHLSTDHASNILKYLSQWGYKEIADLRYAGDKLYQVV